MCLVGGEGTGSGPGGGGGTDSLSVGSDCGTSRPPILGFYPPPIWYLSITAPYFRNT